MKQLTLNGSAGTSDIRIGSGLLQQIAAQCETVFSPSRVHIVTDSVVAPLYLQTVRQQFDIPVTSSVIPSGEEHKRLSTVEGLYHDFLHAGLTRKDLILALGGGVTGDITGFAAATFLRGIPLCQIPTTLLAQVDSSVGGKTAVDLPEGKNLVGAFYQPRLVLIDPDVLSTLPDATFTDGMAEVIKYGCIRSRAILDQIRAPHYKEHIEEIIYECVKIKRDVVEVDEHDTGLRMILNFGHTIGHAAEKLGGYTALTHGQAVAIGMAAAMRLSCALGAARGPGDCLTAILKEIGLPSELPYDREEIFQALLSDKKKMGDQIHFVLVRTLGCAEVQSIDVETLHQLIQTI